MENIQELGKWKKNHLTYTLASEEVQIPCSVEIIHFRLYFQLDDNLSSLSEWG